VPFMLYQVRAKGSDHEYTYVRNAQIAGSRGPLAALQRRKNSGGVCPFPWHAAGREIVEGVLGAADGHEIVIDLKPYKTKTVSLYRVMNVWGYSYAEWTPIALHLESLFDMAHHDPREFKKRFIDRGADRDQVGEFLYLQGGVREGTWNWGMVGRVNGTLLWPDAFASLSECLTAVLRE